MQKDLNLSFERTENSKFATALFKTRSELITYQVKMLTNNRIKYILPASVQQMDGNIKIYYDITDKLSLKEFKGKYRLSVNQFLGLLNSLVNIDDEIDEFQLINSGILFDPEWVFIDGDGSNVEYIYIPNAEDPCGTEEIRNFIIKLVREGYVDGSAQMLVSNLYILLRDEDMSLRDLKDLIYRFEGKNPLNRLNFKGEGNTVDDQKEVYAENEISAEKDKTNINRSQINKPLIKPSLNSKPQISALENKISREKEIIKNKKEEKTYKPQEEKKNTLPYTITGAVNVIIIAGIYKLYTMGVLSTAEGTADITKIGALIIAVLAIDAIVIKNILVKGKNEGKTPKVKKEKGDGKIKLPKAEKKLENIETPDRGNIQHKYEDKQPEIKKPEIPVYFNKAAKLPEPEKIKKPVSPPELFNKNSAAILPELENVVKEKNIPEYMSAEKINKDSDAAAYGEKPENVFTEDITNENTILMTEMSGIEYDETVLMAANNPIGYIERIEGNDIKDKYVIKKDKVIIGRLRSQVDMTVLNPKVGKIHAEIEHREGKFYIKDLKSKNGVYMLNSTERIKDEAELHDGDEFRLADSKFRIHFIK